MKGSQHLISRQEQSAKHLFLTSLIAIYCLVIASCAHQAATPASVPTSIPTPTPKSYAQPSVPRMAVAAASLNHEIYVIGGVTLKNETLALVEEYDPLESLWVRRAPIPTKRNAAVAVAMDGHIFVMGGRDGNTILKSNEMYDPSTNTWSKRANMPTARWFPMAAVVGSRIYVLGGIAGTGNQRQDLDVVEVYDPANDTWTVIEPMPVPRSNGAIAVLGDSIYVIGGRSGRTATARVDVYDTTSSKWLSAPSLGESVTSATGCVLGNKIYVIGGAVGGEIKNSIQVYDLQTNKWTRASSHLSQPRMGAVCSVVGDSIYVLGGVSGSTSSPVLLTTVEKITP